MASDFEKRPWEELWFYHQFKRTPGPGWLRTGEYISSISSIKIYDSAGLDCTTAMYMGAAIVENTKVAWHVQGGTAGMTYEVKIKIITTMGQKFEDHASLLVLAT